MCQYSEALGIPGEGMHKHYFFGMAIFDVLMTIIGAYLIFLLLDMLDIHVNYFTCLAALFVLGIFLHRQFCVCTTVNSILFPNDPMCQKRT